MTPSELRVGVSLIQDREGRICRVEEIRKPDDNDEDNPLSGVSAWPIKGGGQVGLPFSAIPLTEEWLVKLSNRMLKYEQRGNGADWQPQDYISYEGYDYILSEYYFVRSNVWRWKDKDGIVREEDEGFTLYYGSPNCHDSIKDFEYIHQLQNLYFSLTGEELTIK